MTIEEFVKQGEVKKAQPTKAPASSPQASPRPGAIKLVSRDGKTYDQPKKKGGVLSFMENLVKSEIGFGQSIAASRLHKEPDFQRATQAQEGLRGTREKVLQRVKEKQARGEDASELLELLQETGGASERDIYGNLGSSLDKTNLQVLGEAGGVALDLASFGSLPSVGRAVATAPKTTFLRGARQGAFTGLKYGSAFGGLHGVTGALQEGETDIGTIATRGLTEGAVGGALGAGVGGLLGGIGGARQGYKAAKQQHVASNPTALTGYTRDATGNLVKDHVTKEAIKQGFEDVDVRFLKTASPGDRAAYQKMYGMREAQAADKTVRVNAAEVPGKTMNDRVRFLSKERQATGQKIGETIRNMPKQPVDITDDIYGGYVDDLTEAGVRVRADGTLNFNASQFKSTPSVQKHIQQLYDELRPNSKGLVLRTPERVHTIRQNLFNALDLAKKSNELPSNADRILGKVYKNLENPLIAASDDYANLARTYARTSGAIRNYNSLMGKQFSLSDEVANLRAGEVGRRLTGNAPARSMAVVDEIEKLAKELGYTTDESIRNQLIFANDILEQPGVFRAASGSLRGQMERATAEEAVRAGTDVARGDFVSLAGRGVMKGVDYVRNVNPDAKKAVLRKLIGMEDEAASAGTSVGSKLFADVPFEPSAGLSMKVTGVTPKQLADSFLYNTTLQVQRTERPALVRALQGIDTSKITSYEQLADEVASIPGARSSKAIGNWLKTTKMLFEQHKVPLEASSVPIRGDRGQFAGRTKAGTSAPVSTKEAAESQKEFVRSGLAKLKKDNYKSIKGNLISHTDMIDEAEEIHRRIMEGAADSDDIRAGAELLRLLGG